MKPPYYHAIVTALKAQDRYGLPAENEEADAVRKTCLDNNQHRENNRSLWAEFILGNPDDKAAQFMRRHIL